MTHMNYVKKKKSIKCKFEKEIIITRQLLFKKWEFKVFSNVLKLLQQLCKHKLQINIKKNNLQCLLLYFCFYNCITLFWNFLARFVKTKCHCCCFNFSVHLLTCSFKLLLCLNPSKQIGHVKYVCSECLFICRTRWLLLWFALPQTWHLCFCNCLW